MRLKIIAIFVIACAFPVVIQAKTGFDYGAKMAFTRSRLDIDGFFDSRDWRSGLNVAVYAEKEIFDHISLALQLEYAQRGFIHDQVETSETGKRINTVRANTRLDYVSLPVFLQLKVPAKSITPFIQAGPRIDYLTEYRRGKWLFSSVTGNGSIC
ncbi:MAG: porin family protein [candidate division KSB1 bacterium]|nr:porin family protein [candidate division KSB1 bacterium]